MPYRTAHRTTSIVDRPASRIEQAFAALTIATMVSVSLTLMLM